MENGTTTSTSSFRINAKQFFLTYPQCGIKCEELLEGITAIVSSKNNTVEQYCICEEKHANGDPHLHAYIKLGRKCNCRTPTYFDIRVGEDVFHPNIQSVRSVVAVQKYIKKGGHYITNIDKIINNFDQAMELVKKRKLQEAVDLLKRKESKTMVLYYDRVVNNLKSMIGLEQLLTKFVYPEPIVNEFRLMTSCNKTILLAGESGYGKTSFAISLFGNPLLCSHIDQLKEFDPIIHDAIIFDDMVFTHWPRESQIHIVDYDHPRAINVKHSVAYIPAKTKKIITTNRHASEVLLISDKAIRRRIKIIKVCTPLFEDQNSVSSTSELLCNDPTSYFSCGDDDLDNLF